MDKEQIKKALDAFENEKYSDAKDILKKEIQDAKNDFIKDKLNIDLREEEDVDDEDEEDKKKEEEEDDDKDEDEKE